MALLSRIDKTVNCRLFVSVLSGYGGKNVIVLLALLSRIEKTVNCRLFVSVVLGYGGENVIVMLTFCGFIIKD